MTEKGGSWTDASRGGPVGECVQTHGEGTLQGDALATPLAHARGHKFNTERRPFSASDPQTREQHEVATASLQLWGCW